MHHKSEASERASGRLTRTHARTQPLCCPTETNYNESGVRGERVERESPPTVRGTAGRCASAGGAEADFCLALRTLKHERVRHCCPIGQKKNFFPSAEGQSATFYFIRDDNISFRVNKVHLLLLHPSPRERGRSHLEALVTGQGAGKFK